MYDPDDFDEDDFDAEPAEAPELGTCCICGGDQKVVNILMLNLRSPTPGHGWGCLTCGLPSDGATAVFCEGCLQECHEDIAMVQNRLRWVCTGYPAKEGRTPIEYVSGTFDHKRHLHPELNKK